MWRSASDGLLEPGANTDHLCEPHSLGLFAISSLLPVKKRQLKAAFSWGGDQEVILVQTL